LDTIEIRRPILIKVIITENFKKQMISESKEAVENIERNLEALKFAQDSADRARQTEELTRLKENFLQKIKDFETVELGAELPFRNVEGSANLKVGDNILEKITATEVIIKDWIIQEIKHN